MKIQPYPIFLFLFLNVFVFSKGIAQDFEFVKATSQAWAAGMRGGGSGINYQIIVVANESSKKVSIQEVWIKSKFLTYNVITKTPLGKSSAATLTPTFQKGDTLFIRASEFFKDEEMPEEKDRDKTKATKEPEIKREVPSAMKNCEALIVYKRKRKTKELQIAAIEKLRYLAYP